MSLRRWVSIISLALVVLLVVVAWKDIQHAWELLGQVNPWILALIVPAQLLSYYASGAIIASFLRSRGDLKDLPRSEIPRFSLEFNFVNHILPTAGLSGLSYATWRFKKLGVNPSRTALANVLRAGTVFAVFLVFLLLSIFALALSGDVNRLLLLSSGVLSTLIVVGTLLFVYVVVSAWRSRAAGRRLAGMLNSLARRFTRRHKQLIEPEKVEDFFMEMHCDYLQLQKEPRQLKKPLAWSVVFLVMELALFFVVFASFDYLVSPAALLVAYGVAGVAGALVATPGGAGAYEAIMIAVLAGAGVPQDISIAAVVLARVILLVLTLATGYVFYQLTLIKYGKKQPPIQPNI